MAEKRRVSSGAASGALKLLVGTHAALGLSTWTALGLVVIDEQHK